MNVSLQNGNCVNTKANRHKACAKSSLLHLKQKHKLITHSLGCVIVFSCCLIIPVLFLESIPQLINEKGRAEGLN